MSVYRPHRSALYLPASNSKALEKAKTLPCDVVILDLEDAVAPDAKAAARDQAVAAVRAGGFGERKLFVRANGLNTGWGEADLAALATVAPDAVLLPKVDSAADIDAYASLLPNPAVPIWVMIETAKSIFNLNEIGAASAKGRLAGFVAGTNDLAKEMGATLDLGRAPFLGMLGLMVGAARAHGLLILDGVFNDLSDMDGFSTQARQGVQFGFDGKTLIHPSQVAPCNEAFTPDEKAVTWARKVIEAFDDPANADKGAIRVEGQMVERLHLHQARRVLSMAG
jgi:citrate lyase subunit beta / citryl-CoA lyase